MTKTDAMKIRRRLWEEGEPTFRIEKVDGMTTIVCLCCHERSFHPKDVQKRYCGSCHFFHEVRPEPTGDPVIYLDESEGVGYVVEGERITEYKMVHLPPERLFTLPDFIEEKEEQLENQVLQEPDPECDICGRTAIWEDEFSAYCERHCPK